MHTSAPRGRSGGSRRRPDDLLRSRLCRPFVTWCGPPGCRDRARMPREGPHCGCGISCPLVLGDSPGGRVPTISCPSGRQALLLTPRRGSRRLARRCRRLPRAGVSGLRGRPRGETDFNYLEEKLKGRKCQSQSREAADRGSSHLGGPAELPQGLLCLCLAQGSESCWRSSRWPAGRSQAAGGSVYASSSPALADATPSTEGGGMRHPRRGHFAVMLALS